MNAQSTTRREHGSEQRTHCARRPHPGSAPTTMLSMLAVAFLLGGAIPLSCGQDGAAAPQFTDALPLDTCGLSTIGRNPYFILLPGYRLVLEGQEDGADLRVEITVLNEIEMIQMEDLGTVRTRVVEEREWEDGELLEVSRNFFAICCCTNAVYYFGEDVDIYEDGEVASHDGAWRAGQNGARPGLMMPGTFLLGSRYYQEVAPGVALDRAEHVEMGLTLETPAGILDDCVAVLETTPLDPDAEDVKVYYPGIGLVMDEALQLVEFGFVKLENWPQS